MNDGAFQWGVDTGIVILVLGVVSFIIYKIVKLIKRIKRKISK